MICTLQFPPDVEVKVTNDDPPKIEITPVFYKADAKVPICFISSAAGDKVLSRNILVVSGKTGAVAREERPVNPVKAQIETGETQTPDTKDKKEPGEKK